MALVERLFQASMIEFKVEDPTSADAIWCFRQYFAELDARFELGFDPARSLSADAYELVRPRGILVLARFRGEAVGCGALKFSKPDMAEVKRMWVAPAVRGIGLGHRMLSGREKLALKNGRHLLRPETNKTLREAIALYRRCGYSEVSPFNGEPYAHHWFEKRLIAPGETANQKSSKSPTRNPR